MAPQPRREGLGWGRQNNASGEVGVLTGVPGALPLLTGFAESVRDGQSNVRVLSADATYLQRKLDQMHEPHRAHLAGLQ